MKLLRFIKNGTHNFVHRLKVQGWRTTWIWLLGHGPSKLTGIPIIRYSQVTPQIYIGAQFYQRGKQKLELLGVNSSVNMRSEFNDAAHDLALEYYCYLPTEDSQAPTIRQLETGVKFIHQVVQQGGKVYIHCRSGVGRAPTMGAAYFISQGHNLTEALTLIQKPRPFIQITSAQLEQLKRFEENQRTSCSVL